MSGAAALQCCVARSSFNLFGAWHSPESAPVYPPSLLRPAFAPSRSLWHRSCVDTRSCVNTRLGRRVGISARRLSSADDWALKTLRCKTLKLGFLANSSKHLNPSRGPIHRGRRNTVLRAKGSGEEESRSEEGEERRGGGEAEEPRESSGSDAEATAAVTAAVLVPASALPLLVDYFAAPLLCLTRSHSQVIRPSNERVVTCIGWHCSPYRLIFSSRDLGIPCGPWNLVFNDQIPLGAFFTNCRDCASS